MNEKYLLGSTVIFTPADDMEMTFSPAPISTADARQIGLEFCEAGDDERAALLADLGPVMIRRGLALFADLAAKLGEPDSAQYARDLRSQITVGRGYVEVAR